MKIARIIIILNVAIHVLNALFPAQPVPPEFLDLLERHIQEQDWGNLGEDVVKYPWDVDAVTGEYVVEKTPSDNINQSDNITNQDDNINQSNNNTNPSDTINPSDNINQSDNNTNQSDNNTNQSDTNTNQDDNINQLDNINDIISEPEINVQEIEDQKIQERLEVRQRMEDLQNYRPYNCTREEGEESRLSPEHLDIWIDTHFSPERIAELRDTTGNITMQQGMFHDFLFFCANTGYYQWELEDCIDQIRDSTYIEITENKDTDSDSDTD